MAASSRLLWLLPLALGLAGCEGKGPAPDKVDAQEEAATKTESPPAGRLDRSHAGSMAPKTMFKSPDGKAASLADFGGKPLLVNLWATWCAPCIAEMPTLDALAAREKGKLQVLAISQDVEGQQEKVDAFFSARSFAMLEPYVDPDMGLMEAIGAGTLPTTILYDGQGREVWRMTGGADWQSKDSAVLVAEAR